MKYFFDAWQGVQKKIGTAHILLLLDYDGTLTPIAATPDKARLAGPMKGLLRELSTRKGCSVCIISGRGLENIRHMVNLENIIYAGNHGFRIRGKKLRYDVTPGMHYRKTLERIKKNLRTALFPVSGVLFEDKGPIFCLHYRGVDKHDRTSVLKAFHELTAAAGKQGVLAVHKGKKALEIRPPVAWNKGSAALWILAQLKRARGPGKILPIYIGDDLTDEDAFSALRSRGITVVVGKRKKSHAQFYVKTHREAAKMLSGLAVLFKKRPICKN